MWKPGLAGSKLMPKPLFGAAAFTKTFLFKYKYLPRRGCSVEQMVVVVMMLWLLPQTAGPRNLSTKLLDCGESNQKMGWGFWRRFLAFPLVISKTQWLREVK